jgi:hypothetical protein
MMDTVHHLSCSQYTETHGTIKVNSKTCQKLSNDYYFLQRITLLASTHPLPGDSIRAALKKLAPEEIAELISFIVHQKMMFFWMKAQRQLPDLPFSQESRESLRNICFKRTSLYLLQKKTILDLDNFFKAEKIAYVLFKGAHVREMVYDNPAFRPALDIDVLVSKKDRLHVIRLLSVKGYTLIPRIEDADHEVTLVRHDINIDLHWHIMRPGRARIELTDLFLQSRQRCGYFWGLDNETSLLVLLTHPVFTKYATAPQSAIIWFIDLLEWLKKRPIDWQRLLVLLEQSGLKTAAWIMATTLDILTGYRLPVFFLQAITPTKLKRIFLRKWLEMNLSYRWAKHPFVVKYFFTLAAHDNLSDVFRFIGTYQREKRNSPGYLAELQASVNNP